MIIKEIHSDIQRYLENDCYCQYEVYDLTGFFYQLVRPEEECVVLAQSEKHIVAKWKDQLLAIFLHENKVVNIQRVDATENNITELKQFTKDPSKKPHIDEVVKGSSKEALDKIMSIADAVIID
jgi:hypothetical protein